MGRQSSRSIALWFLRNPTAANLLMLACLAGGVIALFSIRQEVFPTSILKTLEVRAEYRGATASELEFQVVEPIERSLGSLRDIRHVVSEMSAGVASIFVLLEDDADAQRALEEVRSAVSGLTSLPADLEAPTITQVRDDGGEIDIGFYGFSSRRVVHDFAARTRERLLALPEVGQVQVEGAGEPEVTVRLSPDRARLFGLSLSDIAQRIQRASFDLSGGVLRTTSGEYGLSTGSERRSADDFGEIALIDSSSGVPLVLSDLAEVEEGFRPHGQRFRINGSLGVMMTIYAAAGMSPGAVSERVNELLQEIEAQFPSIGAVVFDDDARSYDDRVGILAESAVLGLVLVLLLLFLVLEARVAFWVAVGLPVAMLGGVALFSLTPFTINFISIFAFIIVIGVVVDDAVVIGESVFAGVQAGKTALRAAEETLSSLGPAIALAIATNIIAFTPIFFMPGQLGLFLLAMPVVITCVFLVSLAESLWILPSHLVHSRLKAPEGEQRNALFQNALEQFRERCVVPFAVYCLGCRGPVVAIALAVLALAFSWVWSGRMPIGLQPAFESQQVTLNYALSPGAAEDQVDDMAVRLEQLGYTALRTLGDETDALGVRSETGAPTSYRGAVTFTLVGPEARMFSARQFAELWREQTGHPAALTELSIDFLQGPGNGRDLTLELSHVHDRTSRLAAETLVRELRSMPGVEQVSYSGNAVRAELVFELSAYGRALGFDEYELSRRVRAHFDGLEAVRFTRGTGEVRVMVRGEGQGARVLPNLSTIVLISASGQQVPLSDVATARWAHRAVEMRRIDGQRIGRVEATIDPRLTSVSLVKSRVSGRLLPQLELAYPGLTTWDKAIDTNEDDETASGLVLATVVVLASIFSLIGAYSRSLLRSAALLLVIPFCAVGALLGHVLLGIGLSAASFLGVLALGGLVINSGLLLNLRYSAALELGEEPVRAMVAAVRDRFRPIVLSGITTLIGLAPLVLTPSVHAEAMRP
ncbi:MAG: efflux RND transporter permease subunit, partial [Pseudomonadota bacterium]